MRKRGWPRALGGLLSLAACGLLALLSGFSYRVVRADHARIRFSWRARGELVRECRRLTPEELAGLPAHMRQEQVCARRILPYRLRVTLDGALAIDTVVRAGGVNEDRPLFVFQELAVTPGPHRLEIIFEHESPGAPVEESEEDPAHELRETPPRLTLEDSVALGARAIVLVTYDESRRELRLLASPPGSP